MMTRRVKAWGLRLLVVAGIALLCWLSDSVYPALAFVLTWGPNYPFFGLAMLGVLRLPRFLERVRPAERVLYRLVGVESIKWLVTTRAWALLVGFEPPPKPTSRPALLQWTDLWTKGAEACHGAAFVFAFAVALFCLTIGGFHAAVWILAFNLLLNGYPIMLQRSVRWRVQSARAHWAPTEAAPARKGNGEPEQEPPGDQRVV